MRASTYSPWPTYARVPPFLPLALRVRRDGWSAARQVRFIGMLAQTGLVAAAARDVGMSRMAAYRLRRRAADESSFAHAWDAVIAMRAGADVQPKRKVTPEELREWAMRGPYCITMRRGRFVRAQRKPSSSALLRLLSQYDRSSAGDIIEGLEW